MGQVERMTDLEKELTRQIHELSKELNTLRERVAVLEYNARLNPPYPPPWKITAGSAGEPKVFGDVKE